MTLKEYSELEQAFPTKQSSSIVTI